MPLDNKDIDQLVNTYCKDYTPDIEAGLARVHAKVARRRASRRVYMFSAAAAAVMLLFCGIFLLSKDSVSHLTTDGRSVAIHQLPDGSTITLQQGSEVIYEPKNFNLVDRRITLVGQAYFEVHSDRDRPFLVDNGDTELRVTGTAFNLRSEGGLLEVEVSEGAVLLSKGDTKIRIAAKESGLSEPGQPLVHKAAPNLNSHAWRTGELKFERTPITEVISFFKTNWGIRCSWADGAVCNYSVSGNYHDADAASVLADVAKLGGLSVVADEHDPKHFILTGRCAG